MSGELIPEEISLPLAHKVKGMKCGVEPTLVVSRFLPKKFACFEVFARTIVTRANDLLLAEKQFRQGQIISRKFDGLDDALRHHVAVVLRKTSPLLKVAQRRHRVRVRRAN